MKERVILLHVLFYKWINSCNLFYFLLAVKLADIRRNVVSIKRFLAE